MSMLDLLDPPQAGWPVAPRHTVRFYRTDESLAAEVAELAAAALLDDAVFFLIGTPEHRAAVEGRLRAAGSEQLDPDRAAASGRYVPLDACDTLARLRVGDEGDAGRFDAIIGQPIREAMLAGRAVHAFGELVALLAAEGRCADAVRLESQWNALMEHHGFSLWCAYPIDLFDERLDARAFRDICLTHSTVLPGDGSAASEALVGGSAPPPGHLALLIEARRTAEHALAQRDYFLSAAAHELRTPLTGILGYVQLLLRREATEGGLPDGSLRVLGNISAQAQRMRALIDQLLDAAEATSAAMPLARQALDLRDLLTNAAGRARVDRRAVSIAGPSVQVFVDAARIEQVLANLLHNAQRHSGAGPIEIAIECHEDSVSFSVRDHGPGIARERHARIFDRFIHEHPAEQGSGLGLGLYLTREIVEAHGGTIAIESPEGGGSRFVVTLPLPPADRATT